jgi:hypothetical protein
MQRATLASRGATLGARGCSVLPAQAAPKHAVAAGAPRRSARARQAHCVALLPALCRGDVAAAAPAALATPRGLVAAASPPAALQLSRRAHTRLRLRGARCAAWLLWRTPRAAACRASRSAALSRRTA